MGTNRIALAIECKGLKPEFPLLVSCVPRPHTEARHDIIDVSDVMDGLASFARVQPMLRSTYPCLYPAGQGVGKSMRQVGCDSKGDRHGQMIGAAGVFEKWMQALSSLAEMIQTGVDQLSAGSQQPLRKIAFVPVLVVSDGTLWVADYLSNGKLNREPFKADELTFYLGRKYPLERERTSLAISHLHIVTKSKIGSWLQEIAQGGGIWQELFGDPHSQL